MELTGSSVFDYIHPGDHVEMAEQLGMKLPPGRGMSLSQGAVNEDGASSASSSSHSETPEPGRGGVLFHKYPSIPCCRRHGFNLGENSVLGFFAPPPLHPFLPSKRFQLGVAHSLMLMII